MTRALACILFASGCGYAPVDLITGYDMDSDRDGICDASECEAGTDPDNPDSDDDDFDDGEEVSAGTDPLDPDSHPYLGGWEVDGNCSDGITATGNAVGDITEDFNLGDQYGDTVSLYDFCGKVVLITFGAFW